MATPEEAKVVEQEARGAVNSSAPENSLADSEIADFLAELNEEFGKKKKKPEAPHKALNKAFHQQHPGVEKTAGKSPEDPMFHWVPQARVTYVITQHCRCCGDKVSFIGGEYIRFLSKKQHAVITRRADQCADLWCYGWGEEPGEVPDLVDEIHQEVSRCPGCIKVEQMALEIWEQAKKQVTPDPEQPTLDLPGLEDL